MKKKDGGPAFPAEVLLEHPTYGRERVSFSGMSLRDYFAAHAPEMPAWWLANYVASDSAVAVFIEWRWYYADAMLEQREK